MFTNSGVRLRQVDVRLEAVGASRWAVDLSIVVNIPFAGSGVLLPASGNTIGLLGEGFAGGVGADEGCKISSAEAFIGKELEQDIVRGVGSEASRKEAVRCNGGGVCSANHCLDLGTTGTCDDGVRAGELDQVCCADLGFLVVLSVLSHQPCSVVGETSVLRSVDLV